METEKRDISFEALRVEPGPVKDGQVRDHGLISSAHTVDHDSWRQVGLMLVTGFNYGYIYTKLFESDVGSTGLDMGYCVLICGGTLHCIC
ncbi:hypothetical protein RJ639_018266 [Escallonia herrerae]|uniref:Uncharacterized protein n=1 Tax=Escallonia herrerae TaxID=1293975 RepID=A0AA88VAS5_9ASTE|nr:hypothetical protein RJ639_018266 [Escallonia herrerae]